MLRHSVAGLPIGPQRHAVLDADWGVPNALPAVGPVAIKPRRQQRPRVSEIITQSFLDEVQDGGCGLAAKPIP